MTGLALFFLFLTGCSLIAYAMFRASAAADDLSDEIPHGDSFPVFPSIHNVEQ